MEFRGVAAAANKPGSRDNSARWTDAGGNFWLFGGSGFGDSSGTSNGFLNDLWKYDPATNRWTWVKGASTPDERGVYGTMGTPSAANMPGGRNSNATWIDAAGNLWLFGGKGYATGFWGNLNDLWKYSPATNQWTWINGANATDAPAVYGTMGMPSAANTPGAREGSVTWSDASGNLWLFGGFISASNSYGFLNDLWKYDPVINQWTWVKGSNTPDQPGVYGTMGIPSAANVPDGRSISSSWTDAAGDFWLFGGSIWNGNFFNDLWKYTPATNQWTWVKGSNTTNQSGVYGTMGTPSAANTPGAREGSITWSDATGNLWLFGGLSWPAISFNDLWRYTPATNQWTWVKGANTPDQCGVFGTKGTPAAGNRPGARGLSSSWADAAGNLWLFGGIHYTDPANSQGLSNDLWKLGNSSVLPVTLSSIKAYQQSSGITVEWKVENESGIKQYDVEKSSDGFTFTKAAVQPANGNNFSTVNYSWHDVNPAAGNNFYRIRSISSDGEIKYSQVMKVSTGKGKPAYEVYPNPVSNNNIQLQLINQLKGVYHLRLINTFGQVVFTGKTAHEAGSSTETIKPGSHIVKGNYILEVTAPDKSRQSIKIVF